MKKLYAFLISFILLFPNISYAQSLNRPKNPVTKLGINETELKNLRGNPNREDVEKNCKWLTYLSTDYKNYELYFLQDGKLKDVYISKEMMLPKYNINRNMKKAEIDNILEKYKPYKYTNKYIIDNTEYNFYYDISGDDTTFGLKINSKDAKDIDLGTNKNLSSIYEKQLVDLTNVFRVQHDKKILLPLQKLDIVAKKHTTDMIRRNFLNVVDPDGVGGDTRLTNEGLRFKNLGENIANIGNSATDLNRFFIQSELHRTNILSDDFENLGVGICTKGNELYCTQVYFENLVKD